MRRFGWVFPILVAAAFAGCEVKTNSGAATGGGGGAPSAPESPSADVKLSGDITVDGSSTVAPITSLIVEDFSELHPEVRVPVGTSGTSGGFKKFVRGDIDICDASRPISETEIEELKKNGIEWVELQVAIDGLSVCVNPKNDWCKSMTVAQLKTLWEPESKITKWNQIDPSWPDRNIKLFGADTDSGTFEYFTEAVVGKKKSSRADYQQNSEDNVLVQGIAQDEDALGYFGYTYLSTNQDKIKAVAISKTDNVADAVAPNLETIRTGTYDPLSRPLFIYVTKKAIEKPHVAAFLKFYFSDEGQKLVEEAKAVRMSDDQLKATREKLDAALAGK